MKLIERLTTYTDAGSTDSGVFTHGIHPYPAKFIPELSREIIRECTKERNIVLDPFCGSGTTLLEACIAGRKSIGIDSNPVAALISRAKTTALTVCEQKQILAIIDKLSEIDLAEIRVAWVPPVQNLEHWFQKNIITELSWLKQFILDNSCGNLQVFLLCIFSSIIVNVSNQESNTRYAAIEKNLADGVTIATFVRKLKQEYEKIVSISSMRTVGKNTPTVILGSTDTISSDLVADSSVDIVITSPPYANSYDYYLYHKWRMIWLGYDVKQVQKAEIGSRHEHSSKKAPITAFENKMIPVMKNISRMLKPNKLAFFFVGDSIISGEFVDMASCFRKIGEKSNFAFVESAKYTMESITRSFREKKYADTEKKMQHVLVFEPIKPKTIIAVDKTVIAKPKSACKTVDLSTTEPLDQSIISIQNSGQYCKIHGFGKYPAKFIPDLPAWAIEHYSNLGDVVLDPFNGCGTTTTEARIRGRESIGMDISPYACLLARAKSNYYDIERISQSTDEFLQFLSKKEYKKASRKLFFENDLFWFSEDALLEIETIRDYINHNFDGPLLDYYLSVLSTIIKPSSYLDEGQIKVKRDQQKVLKGVSSPIDLMGKALMKYRDIMATENVCSADLPRPTIINETVLNVGQYVNPESVDLIVTSPPYINAMNYAMNNRYESFLLSLIHPKDSIAYQQRFIGTERVYAKDYMVLHQFDEDSLLGRKLNEALRTIYDNEPKRSFIVYKYFAEMAEALRCVSDTLKDGGKFILVAGTNTITGVPIDTFAILVELLAACGLLREKVFHYEIVKNVLKITRHKTSDIIQYDGVAVLKKELKP